MKVNLKKIRISYSITKHPNEAAKLTKAEALSFVWELMKEIYSLSGEFDVKSRLQRNVVIITRK